MAKAKKPKDEAKAEKPAKGSKTAGLDDKGIESVCDDIADGKSLTAIAAASSVSIGTLLNWIEADPERSARAREARALVARQWDEKAEQVLEAAPDAFGLAKARELASHYRWRASKIGAREYGDKVQHANDPDNPMPAPQFIVQPVVPKSE